MNTYLSDEDYDFIYSRVPRICVDLLIKNSKGEVLLTKRDIEPYKDHWHFPGGRIKFRETIQDAIKRIAKAELGENLQGDLPLKGCIQFLEEEQNGHLRHSISLVYEGLILDQRGTDINIVTDIQATEANFFKELPSPIIPPQHEFLVNNGY